MLKAPLRFFFRTQHAGNECQESFVLDAFAQASQNDPMRNGVEAFYQVAFDSPCSSCLIGLSHVSKCMDGASFWSKAKRTLAKAGFVECLQPPARRPLDDPVTNGRDAERPTILTRWALRNVDPTDRFRAIAIRRQFTSQLGEQFEVDVLPRLAVNAGGTTSRVCTNTVCRNGQEPNVAHQLVEFAEAPRWVLPSQFAEMFKFAYDAVHEV